MKVFPDTSFLCSLYRLQVHSQTADAFMNQLSGALPISSLLTLEFRQSVRLQSYLFNQDRSKGFPDQIGTQILRDFQADLARGILKMEVIDWPEVHRIGEDLSHKHTLAAGHRLADLLHVATALHLATDEFLTFDARQKCLAESEGMRVPV